MKKIIIATLATFGALGVLGLIINKLDLELFD